MNMETSKLEDTLIWRIARRAGQDLSNERVIDIAMDITAAHLNGCPLDLERLLKADAIDFAHDVFGIGKNLDRSTGKLVGGFLPRFAK